MEIDDGPEAASAGNDRWQSRQKLADDCKLTRQAARGIYTRVSAIVQQIIDAERAAVELLDGA
jgi:hypothetical protein